MTKLSIAPDGSCGPRSCTAKKPGVHTITAISGSSTGTATLEFLDVARFQVSAFPTTTTAGAPHTITVTGYEATGSVLTGYEGTLHFSSDDPRATLPQNATLNGGTGTFTASLSTAGKHSITVTDMVNHATGTQEGLEVNPGPTTTFTLDGVRPTPVGEAQHITVEARDAYGNADTVVLRHGRVDLGRSERRASRASTITRLCSLGGNAEKAGGVAFTATDTSNPAITGANGVGVQPGPAAEMKVNVPSTVKVGELSTLQVNFVDRFGNAAYGERLLVGSGTSGVRFPYGESSYGGAVSFTASSPGRITLHIYPYSGKLPPQTAETEAVANAWREAMWPCGRSMSIVHHERLAQSTPPQRNFVLPKRQWHQLASVELRRLSGVQDAIRSSAESGRE